ncbi:DUF6630 family protein [Nocardia noduli]|uniref:DUF6630 family protein n=1 Tax=Nocardia noduli TaxID=2815722 RepID=UPI001C24657E|nr:hypothetical protein [Nocardia noduli]
MPGTEQVPQALADIVELFAPGSESIRRRLAEAITTDRERTGSRTAAAILLDALYPDSADLHDAGMVYCDWRSVPTEIRDYLIELPTCPATLSWDWLEEFDEDDWDPEEIDSFLWPLAARCHEMGTALIALDIESDGYGLGFIAADHIDRIVKLAESADCDLRVVHPQVPTDLI